MTVITMTAESFTRQCVFNIDVHEIAIHFSSTWKSEGVSSGCGFEIFLMRIRYTASVCTMLCTNASVAALCLPQGFSYDNTTLPVELVSRCKENSS